MNKLKKFLDNNKNILNKFSCDYIDNLKISDDLKEAIKYSLVNDGKKLRPSLFLGMLDFYKLKYEKYLDIALAIELIHTYSLVHDDLPSMDNDNYRWGKLTNHKVFGENIAILVGDAMQGLSYEIISNSQNINDETKVNLIKYLSNYSGVSGMIGGQFYDVSQNKYKVDGEYLKNMHYLKTGKLLTLPLIFSAYISDNTDDINLLIDYGYELGIAYQIKDDILDYYGEFEKIGKVFSDENMITYLNFYGLEKCEELLKEHTIKSQNIAEKLNNKFLKDISIFLLDRKR